tara:strand:+ start:2326 stop:5349 length:3024 start_codon:yes stop_codon:yes gene_type:complete
MVDKLSRKLTFLAVILAVSLVSLFSLGFRLGLDLQGGTRLVYSVDLDEAVRKGLIDAEEAANPGPFYESLISIWLDRIDPNGVRGAVVRKEGSNRIVIELPGSAAAVQGNVTGLLFQGLSAESQAILLVPEEEGGQVEAFPESGGIIEIDGEVMNYTERIDNSLQGVTRGLDGTARASHSPNLDVTLKASDPWRTLIENTGRMAFHIEAEDADLVDPVSGVQTDISLETEKVIEWVQAERERNGEEPDIELYNLLLSEKQGPVSRLRWFPRPKTSPEQKLEDRLEPLIIEVNHDWRFTGADVPHAYPSQDQYGFPAVGFQIRDLKGNLFGLFTEAHKGKLMAIVIGGEIATMPNIESGLFGGGIIQGQYTHQEVQDMIQVLRSGSLAIDPKFEAQETVGATLGQEYVKLGSTSAGIGLLVVLIFMLFYYRRLGVFAAISLIFNLVALLGAMAFIQATLTLPGVAGIILTVGMAVDANILIYERIREEQARGRKPLQAAKDGFAHAFSTIIDANLTTLITGFILMSVGTGPVKGFATTLCIGIITSVISALMLTRVLVHFQLDKGNVTSWSMMSIIKQSGVKFMSKAPIAAVFSTVVCIGGLSMFLMIDDKDKLGIEFMGGTSAVVRTESPQSQEDMKAMFQPATNPNLHAASTFSDSVTISPILSSADGDGYTSFRITAKDDQSKADESGKISHEQVSGDLRKWLADVLQKGPVSDIQIASGTATGTLYFEKAHEAADIGTALNAVGLVDASATRLEGSVPAYTFTGQTTLTEVGVLATRIQDINSRTDTSGNELRLANPVAELSSVSAQVVTELRDKALAAILLSLFAAVMYIRVRFAEYSFGIAAVIALVHDVLIALGALAIANMLGMQSAEINLSMIAAFLTIIGYSLNDTIVVFDRVRENMPRMKGSLEEILDKSINQTLSRTLLTSVTTLITVLLLFFFNLGTGNVIEGFAFALIIGVLAGTYSSIFIASPALLWLESRRQKGLPQEEDTKVAKASTPSTAS